jgi:hypothetical protein
MSRCSIFGAVAAYWKEHYDLTAIPERDWSTLGPKLQGKLRVYVGSADTYFLTDTVYYLEDFLNSTKNPPYDGEVKYGDRAEHCWNGALICPTICHACITTRCMSRKFWNAYKKRLRRTPISLPGDIDRRQTER